MSELAPIGPGRLASINPATAAAARAAYRPATSVERGDDEVHVSTAAHLMAKLRENPIREDLVAEVREQIQQGTYETPEKLDAAISELEGDL
ncbi:MAG TPA: flagellar biosynthesis anti-sigma factor FlgM [Phycisphaerales bacterium]|nr:flagellar biosynthesis anti-sigma factor FlgM [Phycisphaerales bacterium]